MGANGVALTASGSGYTGTSFTVSIAGNGGSGASATATLGTSVQQLTITALGDKKVLNHAYSGPQASDRAVSTRSSSRGTTASAVASPATRGPGGQRWRRHVR